MSTTDDDNGPSLTIVGGQPRKRPRVIPGSENMEVPVTLEMLLYEAARDRKLKARLLADRDGTVAALGIELRPSEQAILASVSDQALERMIDHIVPDNPRGRRLMRHVAAAATTLAAGTVSATALVTCEMPSDGSEPSTDVDGGTTTTTTGTTTSGDGGGGAGGIGGVGGADGGGGTGGAGGG